MFAFIASGCRASNPAPVSVGSHPVPPAFSEDQSLSRDAAEIARASGEDPRLAQERLDFQIRSGPAVGVLRRLYADRLVGVSRVATEQGFVLRVLLQGLDPAPVVPNTAETEGIDVIVEVGARFTGQQLRALVASKQRQLTESVPAFLSAFVEERTGDVVVFLRPVDGRSVSDEQAAVEEVLGTQVVVRRSTGRFEGMSMAGSGRHVGAGLGRPGCTGSFPARRGRQSGVLSAAHCENDNVYYNGVDGEGYRLSVSQESWTASTDVQFMVGHSLAKQALRVGVRPEFYENAWPNVRVRELVGSIAQSSLAEGDTICKYGAVSGYSCGKVVRVLFAPPYPFSDCNGGPCGETWVLMGPLDAGTPFNCAKGDSGGPWFVGGRAVGIMMGSEIDEAGRCFYAVFMSVDRISVVGAELHIAGREIPIPKQ
jgi:hypothetical protein